jgi:hypothetical protein
LITNPFDVAEFDALLGGMAYPDVVSLGSEEGCVGKELRERGVEPRKDDRERVGLGIEIEGSATSAEGEGAGCSPVVM